MKSIKRYITFVLALATTLAFALPAFGATITIHRDDSWDGDAVDANATYTYYKIFDAEIVDAAGVDQATGALTSEGNVVYTISGAQAANKIAALPDIFTSSLAADNKYYITLADENTGASTIVEKLEEMVTNPANAELFPGTSKTSNDDPVELTVDGDGYYLILASNGKNAAVQTIGNVEINEKNDYPKVTKEQKKAADPNYSDAKIPAEIGTYVDFKVTVDVPLDANKSIAVFDVMSGGLQYDSTSLEVKINGNNVAYDTITVDDDDYDSNADWQIRFTGETVSAHRGETIVITYRALITEACLVDTERDNEVTLSYDEGNYKLTDETEYETYFGGIEKVDGSDHNVKLSGVTFEVKVGENDFNVYQPDGKDYYIPGGDKNEVTTAANGKIIIRGLDSDKTYTLIETATKPGYNLLEGSKDLTLAKDEGTAYTTTNLDQIENNKGAQMPSTGGIGTTIFYIVGGVMVAGAAIFLLTKRRVTAE